VDGAKSTDPVFGWGPRGGYVYQKAFVEFFALGEDVEGIISKVESEGKGWVDYYAVNLEVRSLSLATGFWLRGRC
jgi:methylenetetrahydrofolate reductase (NADPH)